MAVDQWMHGNVAVDAWAPASDVMSDEAYLLDSTYAILQF